MDKIRKVVFDGFPKAEARYGRSCSPQELEASKDSKAGAKSRDGKVAVISNFHRIALFRAIKDCSVSEDHVVSKVVHGKKIVDVLLLSSILLSTIQCKDSAEANHTSSSHFLVKQESA